MWVLKVYDKNKKTSFLMKSKTLEDLADLRSAAIRMGYIPNKKCFWEIQKKYDWDKKNAGKFGGKSGTKKNKSLQKLYPGEVGSLTAMPRKVVEVKPKRVRQHKIDQSRNWF